MPVLELESLLQALPGDSPAGANLEYDSDFQELGRIAAVREADTDLLGVRKANGADDVHWTRARDLALNLFSRTRDLRVAVHLTFTLVRIHGLPGLASGLTLTAGMLEQFWASVHPRLIEQDGNDPIERINALASFTDRDHFLPMLCIMPVAEARGVGVLTVRDLDVAKGRVQPRSGDRPNELRVVQGAWRDGDPEKNAARTAAVEEALQAAGRIQDAFRVNNAPIPDLSMLVRTLKSVQEFFAEMNGKAPEIEKSSESHAATDTRMGPNGPASRSDAVRLLRQVSEYMRQTEPSSPAPILIDRAVRLIEMDFLDIVQELMPDARDRIELIGGFKFEESNRG